MDSEAGTSHSGDRAKVSHTSSNPVSRERSFAASESSPFSEWRVIRPKRRIGDPRKEPLRNWTILVERGGRNR